MTNDRIKLAIEKARDLPVGEYPRGVLRTELEFTVSTRAWAAALDVIEAAQAILVAPCESSKSLTQLETDLQAALEAWADAVLGDET